MTRRRKSSRERAGNRDALRLPETSAAITTPPASSRSSNPWLPRKYRELVRKHLGQLFDKLFEEFTGVHFHIAWAPSPSHKWATWPMPTACPVCCRLSGSPLVSDCRVCGPRHLARAFGTAGRGHRFTCRLGVRNYWFPIRVRDETLGIAYLQALDRSAHKRSARKDFTHRMRLRFGGEDARVMSRLEFARATRFLRLIVQHSQTSSLADLQKEDLGNVQRVLRVLENVQKRARKNLSGLMPAFRETSLVAQSETRPEQLVHAILDRIRRDYAQPLTLRKCAGELQVNAAYLSHLFSRAVGLSFKTCLTEVRVEKARELLGDPSKNISQVAKAVGYASANRFRIAFKNVAGLAPRTWRETFQLNPRPLTPSN